MIYCFVALVSPSECLLMKCSALFQPLLTGICTSLAKGGSKLGSDSGGGIEVVIADVSEIDCVRLGRLGLYSELPGVEAPALVCGFSGGEKRRSPELFRAGWGKMPIP